MTPDPTPQPPDHGALCGAQNPDYPGEYACEYPKGHGTIFDDEENQPYDHAAPSKGVLWVVFPYGDPTKNGSNTPDKRTETVARVTTRKELNALPGGSVVLDINGLAWQKGLSLLEGWFAANGTELDSSMDCMIDLLPVTLLRCPNEKYAHDTPVCTCDDGPEVGRCGICGAYARPSALLSMRIAQEAAANAAEVKRLRAEIDALLSKFADPDASVRKRAAVDVVRGLSAIFTAHQVQVADIKAEHGVQHTREGNAS